MSEKQNEKVYDLSFFMPGQTIEAGTSWRKKTLFTRMSKARVCERIRQPTLLCSHCS